MDRRRLFLTLLGGFAAAGIIGTAGTAEAAPLPASPEPASEPTEMRRRVVVVRRRRVLGPRRVVVVRRPVRRRVIVFR